MNQQSTAVSIIIPLYNEEESLEELHDWIVRVVEKNQLSYEIIFVDDGSKDESWTIIKKLKSNLICFSSYFLQLYHLTPFSLRTK